MTRGKRFVWYRSPQEHFVKVSESSYSLGSGGMRVIKSRSSSWRCIMRPYYGSTAVSLGMDRNHWNWLPLYIPLISFLCPALVEYTVSVMSRVHHPSPHHCHVVWGYVYPTLTPRHQTHHVTPHLSFLVRPTSNELHQIPFVENLAAFVEGFYH